MASFLDNLSLTLKRRRLRQRSKGPTLKDVVIARAVEDSADFVEANLAEALLFRQKDAIRGYAIRRIPAEGMVLEFGVNEGVGINFFADVLAGRGDRRRLTGFDAFRGLSEDWYGKTITAQTAFDRGGRPPKVRASVDLVIGWVDDTVGPFLERNEGPVAFAHLDLDTYTPTRQVLDRIAPRLVPGSILLFDEHHGYPNWRNGEFRALVEALPRERYIYRAFGTQQAVIEIVA
jgi:hypothetical protein